MRGGGRVGEDADAGAELLLPKAEGGGVAAAGDERHARADDRGGGDSGDSVGVAGEDERKVLEGRNGGLGGCGRADRRRVDRGVDQCRCTSIVFNGRFSFSMCLLLWYKMTDF